LKLILKDKDVTFLYAKGSLWVFLMSHGTRIDRLKGPAALINIDTGEVGLEIESRDDSLAELFLLHPLYHLAVDFIVTRGLGSGVKSPFTIHKRVKRGHLKKMAVIDEINSSCISFHAATSGVHRLGISYRLSALQLAVTEKIASELNLKPDLQSPLKYITDGCIREEDEEKAALVALASGILRALKLDEESLKAEMTTSILLPQLAQLPIVEACSAILKILDSIEYPRLSVKLDGSVKLTSEDWRLKDHVERLSNAVLGRIFKRYERVQRCLKGLNSHPSSFIIDYSEQMGLADAYLVASIVESLWGSCRKAYIIATPLSYPMAALAAHYLKDTRGPFDNVVFRISSEDPEVAAAMAHMIVKEERESEALVYLATGPTSHVASMALNLRKELGDRVLMLP